MTPTSAPGRTERRARRGGFTLVELLVVVTIVGLAAGAVVLTAPPPRPSTSVEAERLAAKLLRAREEALLSNRLIAAEVDAAGYRFIAYDQATWTRLEDGPFQPANWPDGVGLIGVRSARVTFDPTGAAEPVILRLKGAGGAPIITIDVAGEVRLEE